MADAPLPSRDPTTDKPPRPRRWIPLSLRMFLAMLVLAGAGSVTWFGFSILLTYHREQEVVRTIQGWDRFNSDHHFIVTEIFCPEWLRRLVGQDRLKEFKVFDRVVNVELQAVPVNDMQMAQLGRLTNVQTLLLSYTGTTDAGLAHLSELTNLRSLHLERTAITDSGLAKLSPLKNLCEIYLRETAVTDAGLAHLSGLTQLEFVSLQRTAVTDAGLVHLGRLTNLKDLALHGTHVTDEGIETLKIALPNCKINH